MDVLTAHAMLAKRRDRSEPEFMRPIAADHQADLWPSIATAAVVVSGQLEDCQTDEDLDAAMQHTAMLLGGEILTAEQLNEAAAEVVREVLAWGESYARN